MIRIRLADPDRTPHAIAEARAELARLTADQRPTYLGMRVPTVIAVGLAAAAIGAAIGLAIPTPLERCAELNGAPLTAEACAAYLAELDRVDAACGPIAKQLTFKRCPDDVLGR